MLTGGNHIFFTIKESPKAQHIEERIPKSKSHRTIIQLQKQDSDVGTKPVKTRETTAESSDESTIISSQTSTLTRSFGPEAMLAHADLARTHLKQVKLI